MQSMMATSVFGAALCARASSRHFVTQESGNVVTDLTVFATNPD